MANEAVVIIDVQNAILKVPGMTRPSETQTALDAVVARITALIKHARQHAIPLLFVQHDGQSGHRLERGSPGWELRPEIAPAQGEPIIHKLACDAFFETTLAAELQSRNIDTLIVAGCMTQYCIDTSGALTFEQIIAHHNALLDGFDAGSHSVAVTPLQQILR
jgi:nicotinamidase-related amidase